jgi:hypothetical protein
MGLHCKESSNMENIVPSYSKTNYIIIQNTHKQCLNIFNQIINYISPEIIQIFSRENLLNAMLGTNQTIYLQKRLKGIGKNNIDYIIVQLHGIFREIMKDKNGNYFCSDLFKECDQEQRIKILNELSPTLADDCLNNYASHAIQSLIDRASSEYEYRIILSSFNDYNKLFNVSLDPCGAYTVQKIIERIPDRYREEFNFIFSSFIGFISRKKYGIVAVKKFISGTKSEAITNQIMKLIYENFMDLAVDQYANYLIQFLLEIWNNTPEGNTIKRLVFDNFVKMSQKKYSSFICELCIKIISPEEKNEIINSMIKNIQTIKDNNHSIKIMKLLGIIYNSDNNFELRPNVDNRTTNNAHSKYTNNDLNNNAHQTNMKPNHSVNKNINEKRNSEF